MGKKRKKTIAVSLGHWSKENLGTMRNCWIFEADQFCWVFNLVNSSWFALWPRLVQVSSSDIWGMSGDDASFSQQPAGELATSHTSLFWHWWRVWSWDETSLTKFLGGREVFFWSPKVAAMGGRGHFWESRLPFCPSRIGGYSGSNLTGLW